jgi:hypothetical protein
MIVGKRASPLILIVAVIAIVVSLAVVYSMRRQPNVRPQVPPVDNKK